MNGPAILRLPAVRERTGYSRSGVYAKVAEGLFPRPVSMGTRTVGWPSTEVDEIVQARIAGLPVDRIRALVSSLAAGRCKGGFA